jgi:hypothetical protein
VRQFIQSRDASLTETAAIVLRQLCAVRAIISACSPRRIEPRSRFDISTATLRVTVLSAAWTVASPGRANAGAPFPMTMSVTKAADTAHLSAFIVSLLRGRHFCRSDAADPRPQSAAFPTPSSQFRKNDLSDNSVMAGLFASTV